MQTTRRFSTWKIVTSELGMVNTLLYGLKRVLAVCHRSLFLHRYYLVAQPVRQTALLPARFGKSIQVRRIDSSDPVLLRMERPLEVLQSRYDQGSICFGAFKDDRLIGYLWLLRGNYLEDEVRCRFVPRPEGKAGWDFDVYLDPEHRLSFAFPRLWDEANVFLRAHGIEWNMSRISAFNRGSFSAHQRLGAHRIGSVLFVGAHTWQLMLASLPPYIHLSWSVRQIPEIHLYPPSS